MRCQQKCGLALAKELEVAALIGAQNLLGVEPGIAAGGHRGFSLE
jgi:hypothetical protein